MRNSRCFCQYVCLTRIAFFFSWTRTIVSFFFFFTNLGKVCSKTICVLEKMLLFYFYFPLPFKLTLDQHLSLFSLLCFFFRVMPYTFWLKSYPMLVLVVCSSSLRKLAKGIGSCLCRFPKATEGKRKFHAVTL
ncbi:hypothetical protein BY458DRAFT_339277 [Sporodiniella umbellata]|nr:hypothetical protein BY458DRAFT_339277 [Sporodiniella umbellata]